MTFNTGGNNAMVQNTLITNARRDALGVSRKYYSRLIDYLTDDKGNLDIFNGQGELA